MESSFLKAIPILDNIEAAGFEAYFVGGSVRDFLLKREITDVDIATSATPDEIKTIFPKTIDVGIQHGTVIVLYKGESYEVTTFRSESDYIDFRRPNSVTFIRTLHEDLRRRDFTMNAIAMNKKGELIDPFHGQASISAKEIKTVGDAKERFHEDALRMMRALRFVSQLFFSIDPLTFHALKEHGRLIKNISVERLSSEFEKLLLGGNYQRALSLLIETRLFQHLPGLQGREKELSAFLEMNSNEELKVEERWVVLLLHLGLTVEDVELFLRKWKQPGRQMKRVKLGLYWLYSRLDHDWTTEEIYKAKREIVLSTQRLFNLLKGEPVNADAKVLEERWISLPIKERNELAVTGSDLMDWFQLKGGPWIEEKLKEIEKAVITGALHNEKEAIREWLFQCNQA